MTIKKKAGSGGMKMARAGILAAGLALAGLAGYADRTVYVSPDGTNNAPYTNWADAATNILWAVDAATNGDTVLIDGGLYVLTNTVNITKGIRVQGLNGAGATTIDGDYAARCFNLNSNAILDGLTITRGTAIYGGGVYCTTGTIVNCVITGCVSATNDNFGGGGIYAKNALTLTNCIIVSNHANYTAGGVSAYDVAGIIQGCWFINNEAVQNGGAAWSTINFTNCVFTGNRALSGGAVQQWYSGIIADCLFSNNWTTGGSGGALHLNYSTTNLFVLNCTVISNFAAVGGGVYMSGPAIMRNSLVAGNVADPSSSSAKGGGVSARGGWVDNCTIVSNAAYEGGGVETTASGGGTGTVVNTIIYNNACAAGRSPSNWYHSAGSFTNCCTMPTNGIPGSGNIAEDPLFAGPETGNYRLLPDSPCVDAGLNQEWMATDLDLDRGQRLDRFKRIVDIGAYEAVPEGGVFITR